MHLFAGAGGGLLCDLILGHDPIIAVEWDPYCCAVLRERAADGWWPELRVHEGDVRMFDPSPYAGEVGCIAAGFPCQPFSIAGIRKGTRDERDLFGEVLRCVEVIRPQYIFLENVPGILSSRSPTCVCGWPYRRGGVHQNTKAAQQTNLSASSKYQYDCESRTNSDGNAKGVRRAHLQTGLPSGEMGKATRVAYYWGRCGFIFGKDSPILDVEAETSRFSDLFGCYEDGIGMDGRNEKTRSHHEGKNASAQQKRTNCPECGRRLVRGAGLVSYMGIVLRDLAASGYDARWTCIPASAAGAPHYRDRWWCLAESADTKCVNGKGEQSQRIDEKEWEEQNKRSLGPLDLRQLWWAIEPPVGRVDHGVAHRSNRIKALGEGQVPVQAATAWVMLGGPVV